MKTLHYLLTLIVCCAIYGATCPPAHAAYDFDGTNQYLEVGSAVVTTEPLTMACWFNLDNTTAGHSLISIGANAGNNQFALQARGDIAGDPIRVFSGSAGTAAALSSTGYSASTWHHAAGVFASTTSRTVYLDGGNSGSDSTSASTTGVDRTRIGARYFSGLGFYTNGRIAEVGIWNAALTTDEIAALAKGISPRLIRPQSLVFYTPLVRDIIDLKGGASVTNTNTATVADHPRKFGP